MRKRRAFALLLALSLAVGGNSVTVSAAGALPAKTFADQSGNGGGTGSGSSESSSTGESGTGDSSGTGGSGVTSGGSGTGGSGGTGDSSGTGGSGGTGNNGGSGTTGGGSGTTDGSGTTGGSTGGSGGSGDQSGSTGGSGTTGGGVTGGSTGGSDQSGSTGGGSGNEGGSGGGSGSEGGSGSTGNNGGSGNTDGGSGSAPQNPPAVTAPAVPYDVAEASSYTYTVEKGVLQSIKKAVTVDGKEAFAPVTFSGRIELKQPTAAESQYTCVAADLFAKNTSLTGVKLPEGVTSIAAGGFEKCTALAELSLPDSLLSIGEGAFAGCSALKSVSLPKKLREIGAGAFAGDAKLYRVQGDADYSDLQTIGDSAFAGCTALVTFCSGTGTGFRLPVKVESVGEKAFQGAKLIAGLDFTNNTKLASIGGSAFAGCTGLRTVTFGKSLGALGADAFAGCSALSTLTFPSVGGGDLTIAAGAFRNCYNLKKLTLPQSVKAVEGDAFAGCTKLTRVEVGCDTIALSANSFPKGEAKGLVIIAKEGSKAYEYALRYDLLPDAAKYYHYSVEDVDGNSIDGGKFAGGLLWVGNASKAADAKDINTLNSGKGVKGDGKTEYYIFYKVNEGYTFVAESLLCNGERVQKDKGVYSFVMPEGGAVITAEFRPKTPGSIAGKSVTVEFSAGTPIDGGSKDELGCLGVELKVGQTARMFLLDEEGQTVPASKVTVASGNTKVAKVDGDGVITAVGTDGAKVGRAQITATVTGGDGKLITVNRTILVSAADAATITLKASGYSEALVEVAGDADGIQTASISRNVVAKKELSFQLKANVGDGANLIGRELVWTSSNAKVAALSAADTKASDPTNTVTVVKGCLGEATITVTAKNGTDAEKSKITQKFVVRVYQEGYRLASSAITVNPDMSEGGLVELLSTAGQDLSATVIKLYNEKDFGTPPFTVTAEPAGKSTDCFRRFRVMPVGAESVKEGTYKVRVGVGESRDEKELFLLTITVKRSVPNPTITFNSKKVNFNLFYKNGGTDKKGDPIVVTTQLAGLGDAEVGGAKLEALSQKLDDGLFLENFEVAEVRQEGNGKAAITIRKKNSSLRYTEGKKPALTGYLVISYKGYGEAASKRVKVTMPTVTTAPSYALREEKASYRVGSGALEERLTIYDKASKKQEDVPLDAAYTVTEERGEIHLTKKPVVEDGAIVLGFTPEAGKLKLVLKNAGWDVDKNGSERSMSFVFTLSMSSAKPVIRTNVAAVALNQNYPETPGAFTLVSSQRGLVFAQTQRFVPVVTDANAAEIGKLSVTYENGKGLVAIRSGQKVRRGTYRFTCSPQADWPGLADMTLTVKVSDERPAVKLGKGALRLNAHVYNVNGGAGLQANTVNAGEGQASAGAREVYLETSKLPFQMKGAPEGYALAPVGTGEKATEVRCTGKGRRGMEQRFAFGVAEPQGEEKEGVLSVSLKDGNVRAGKYEFTMTPRYLKEGVTPVSAAPIVFNVTVVNTSDIGVTVKAKGKINLVNREGEESDKNGIVYTPTLKNISGEIEDVKIYDASSLEEESKYFNIRIIEEGKDKGKFYVTPKKTVEVAGTATVPPVYGYAQVKNGASYPLRIWVKVKGYAGSEKTKGGVLSSTVRIKTGQTLPKVKADRSTLNLYLSTKGYDATFVVRPAKGSVGALEGIAFGEKDKKAQDSFELIGEPLSDGSLRVIVHVKEGVEYANGSTVDMRMYLQYKGQGTNTKATATPLGMKFKIN